MAITSKLKAANVTKVDAGGSGDNYVGDGLIKTVEKVWTDTYTLAAVTGTATGICIGKVPKGKRITDIIVHLPAWGTATNATVSLCEGSELPGNTGTTGSLGLVHGLPGNFGNTTKTALKAGDAQTVRLNPANVLSLMGENEDIYLMFTIATTLTGGTIRSIIKYV